MATKMKDVAHEAMAAAVAAGQGSITAVPEGALSRGLSPWNAGLTWQGHRLTQFLMMRSNWTRSWRVTFYASAPAEARHKDPVFTLHLSLSLPEEEVRQAAEVYMELLNMQRVD